MKVDKVPFIEAKYHASRKGVKVDLLVMHYTAGSGDALRLAKYFASAKEELSAHFGIGRKPEKIEGVETNIVQCVDTDRNAYHPGLSKFRGEPGTVGRRSIGIEVCNLGYNVKSLPSARVVPGDHRNPASSSTKWEAYTDEQYLALEWLLPKLKEAHPDLKYVCGHEDIRNSHVVPSLKGSKLDPGPAFQWGRLEKLLADLELEEWHYSFKRKIWYKGLPVD